MKHAAWLESGPKSSSIKVHDCALISVSKIGGEETLRQHLGEMLLSIFIS